MPSGATDPVLARRLGAATATALLVADPRPMLKLQLSPKTLSEAVKNCWEDYVPLVPDAPTHPAKSEQNLGWPRSYKE